MANEPLRYRQAAADYTGLPVESFAVRQLAAQAASMADWAALEFLREEAHKRRPASPPP